MAEKKIAGLFEIGSASTCKDDGPVKSLNALFVVVPERAVIECYPSVIASRPRGNDRTGDFLLVHQG
jgi:hypothetical protein